MPGLFDGLRIGIGGVMAYRRKMEVVANNIANASNENYTRQEARLETVGSTWDGQNFFGQGVDVTQVIRIRDELLDDQLRDSASTAANYSEQVEWLSKIEALWNEPSDTGISAAFSKPGRIVP